VLADNPQSRRELARDRVLRAARRHPFTVVVNLFDGQLTHDLAEVRDALDLSPGIPLTRPTHATATTYSRRCEL